MTRLVFVYNAHNSPSSPATESSDASPQTNKRLSRIAAKNTRTANTRRDGTESGVSWALKPFLFCVSCVFCGHPNALIVAVNVMKPLAVAFLATLVAAPLLADELPLHERIDQMIEDNCVARGIPVAELADDAEFLRRVYLDLTGIIPSVDAARSFLKDRNEDKRQSLIDHLLDSPEYPLQMARVFDVLLTERRIATIKSYDVPSQEWRAYLAASFAANKTWDQLVREILNSDGTDPQLGAAAKFFLVRDTEPHPLTRDVGRLFLGVDLQCAQCHDDPRYEDYKQADYYGIYAFLNRVEHFRDEESKRSFVVEKATGNVEFTSVFSGMQDKTNPRLPGGEMIAEPQFEKGQEYEVAPAKGVRPVPKYSRRAQLADHLPRAETAGFSRNIANRLWAQLMGRGLVHPLDLRHAKNPASHPALLDLLEQRLADMNYDIKAFLRELAFSRTYQRSSRVQRDQSTSHAPIEIAPEAFAVAPLRALTPEQLGWSVLRATGQLSVRMTSAAEKLENGQANAAWKTEVYLQLERDVAPFVRVFSGLPGQPDGPFEPSVDQSLYLLNGEKILGLLNSDRGRLVDRLTRFGSVAEVADELYVSVLSRRPEQEELTEVADYLENVSSSEERAELIRQLVWGKLLSAEFRLNH